MTKKILFLILLGIAMTLPAHAAPKDNPKCEENPVFNRFKGEYFSSCEQSRYDSLSLWRWKDVNKPRPGAEEEFKVEGEYWYYFNEIEKDASGRNPGKLEIRRNYENAVRQAKGTILNASESNGTITYHVRKPDGEYWGQVGCGRGGSSGCDAIMHKIVRTAAMEQSVVVSADQIAKSVLEEGKVVFYGIYFDSGKAVVKKESAPTLAEIAAWLKKNASTKVFIVGHTDMQGSKEQNIGLSRARGAAVVEELVSKYGIARSRLTPEGVGPLAPVATNSNEAGRAKNRRVEMVLQ